MSMLDAFLTKIDSKQTKVGIIGLGYVGLPLAITYAKKGFHVLGLDIDPKKPEAIHAGHTCLEHLPAERFFPLGQSGHLEATTDFDRCRECDALIICVPTPLTKAREPSGPHTGNIPKVVGGHTPDCLAAGKALYAAALDHVVPVSSTRAAEMTFASDIDDVSEDPGLRITELLQENDARVQPSRRSSWSTRAPWRRMSGGTWCRRETNQPKNNTESCR